MFTKQEAPQATSLSFFLIMARVTVLVRLGPEAPVDPFEMSDVEYRQMVEAIEPERVFDEIDEELSGIHRAFVRYIVPKHESRTTLDAFANELEYDHAHRIYREETGIDYGVRFDRDELNLARSGLLFGRPLLYSFETPLSEPALRAAKFVHLVISKLRHGEKAAGDGPSVRLLLGCLEVAEMFSKAGIYQCFNYEDFVFEP
ncbi:hypothetical protein FRC09_009078 [Ceratobasidium sp. 395]|nr:hypothetical protein FRC09_009078 [Ceratobasidium sp. 395]